MSWTRTRTLHTDRPLAVIVQNKVRCELADTHSTLTGLCWGIAASAMSLRAKLAGKYMSSPFQGLYERHFYFFFHNLHMHC
jgi:hypothetical protein